MATTIKLKNGSGAPLAGDLVQGEPALDLTNKRLYTENASGTVIEVGTNPTSLTTGTFTSTGIDDNATSTAITIDSSQNVGVGTASPDGTFHVKDAIAQVYIQSNDGQPSQVVFGDVSDASGGMIEYTSSNEMTFKTNNLNERMRIDSSGNVGVGLTPENSSGTWRNFEQGGMNLAGRTAGGVDGMIGTNYVFKTNNSEVYKYTAATSRLFFDANEMIFQQAGSGTAGTAITWSEAMRIDASGNVGIGTASPNELLTIESAAAGTTSAINLRHTDSSSNTRGGTIVYNVNNGTSQTNAVFLKGFKTGNTSGGIFTVSTADTSWSAPAERMRIDSSGDVFVKSGGQLKVERSGASNFSSFYTDTADSTIINNSWSNQKIVLTRDGNVGIGTSSPDEKLEVYQGNIKLGTATNTTSKLIFERSAVDRAEIYAGSSNQLQFDLGGSERMRIDSSGNVGIGTSSPTSRLHIDGAEDRTGGVTLSAGAQNHTWFLSSDFVNVHNIETSSGAAAHTWQTNGTERMRVDSSGNVGIGESAPQYKLDINGANTAGNVDVAAFTNPVNAAGTGHGARILIHSTQNPSRGVGIASVSTSNYAADNAMAFYTSASSTLYERMRIDQYGNVSVRTTTGIGKLIGPRGNEVTVADDATVNLVINTAGACFIHAYDVGLGDGAVFFGTYKGGTTNIAAEGTHGWSTSDTDGNYCIYKSGNSHTITFKNRTGASRTMVFLVTAANTI